MSSGVVWGAVVLEAGLVVLLGSESHRAPGGPALHPSLCADDESDSDAEEEQTTVRDSAVPSWVLSQCHIAGKQISVPVSWEVLGELGLSGAEYKSTSHPTYQWRLPRSCGWSSSALYK